MNEAELMLWGQSLLLKIHVITGWVIPESNLLVILVDQFQKKLLETYPNMNIEEIEFAFRNWGTSVKDWGKAMNLALIDSVLVPYLDERKRLSHELEERKMPPPQQKIYSSEELENFAREDIEYFFQRLRKGIIPTGVPDYFSEVLKKDGLLKPGEMVDLFFADRLNKGFENIYTKA